MPRITWNIPNETHLHTLSLKLDDEVIRLEKELSEVRTKADIVKNTAKYIEQLNLQEAIVEVDAYNMYDANADDDSPLALSTKAVAILQKLYHTLDDHPFKDIPSCDYLNDGYYLTNMYETDDGESIEIVFQPVRQEIKYIPEE